MTGQEAALWKEVRGTAVHRYLRPHVLYIIVFGLGLCLTSALTILLSLGWGTVKVYLIDAAMILLYGFSFWIGFKDYYQGSRAYKRNMLRNAESGLLEKINDDFLRNIFSVYRHGIKDEFCLGDSYVFIRDTGVFRSGGIVIPYEKLKEIRFERDKLVVFDGKEWFYMHSGVAGSGSDDMWKPVVDIMLKHNPRIRHNVLYREKRKRK